MNKIYCLVGKSGVGKTVIEKLIQTCLPLKRVISYTSRPPRDYEEDGYDYNFVCESAFLHMKDENLFTESTTYRNWHYGICKYTIDLKENNYICVIEPYGLMQMQKYYGDAVVPIYLYINDKTRLMRSLEREEKPNVDEVIRRYITDKDLFKEVEEKVKYRVENESLFQTLNNIRKIIQEESHIKLSYVKMSLKYIFNGGSCYV